MSWTDRRIKEIQAGKEPTFLEKGAFEHGNPVNFILSMLALVVAGYGLWINELWPWLAIAVVLGFLGHLYCWLKK